MGNDTTTRKLEMKPVEVAVGAGAAVITAFATSYFGTAGTLTGAALASVVGTVSTSLLRSSADRSSEKLRETTARLRETHSATTPRPTDIRPVESGTDRTDLHGTPLLGAPDPAPAEHEPTRGRVRRQWVVLGVSVVIAFAVALVAITGIESAAGKPLAGLTGKQAGGGTTVGRVTGTDTGSSGATTPASPTPTTSGSPSPSETGTPSGSPTGEPSVTEPSSAPSMTTPAPSATQPAPAPSPSPSPLTSRSP
jgi:hypothetical protein